MQGSGSEVLEIRIGDLNHSGEGVGRKDGRVVFVPYAAPGDVAVVRVTENKRSFARAELLSIVRESPDRVLPPCPVYLKCGGCQLQHISYEAQLAYKTRRVKQALERIGKLEHVGVRDCLPAPKTFHYRNKARFSYEALSPYEVESGFMHVSREGQPHGFPEGDCHLDGSRELPGGSTLCCVDTRAQGQRWFISGFYGRRTHDVVDLNECMIQNPTNNRVFEALNELVAERGIPVHGCDALGKGTLKHLLVRCAGRGDRALAVLVTSGGPLAAVDDIARDLTARAPELEGVIEDVGGEVFAAEKAARHVTRASAGLRVIAGQGFLQEHILGLRFIVSAESFLQVNPEGMEVLYKKALEVADLTGDEIAVDAYSGIGTISLLLARECRHVYGIEAVETAVEDAARNAARNHISNCTFIRGRVEEVLANAVGRGQPRGRKVPRDADVVVLDPPRAGCDKRALDAVVSLKPGRIVYVSCNPETLVRDLAGLEASGYRTRSVQPVDMFPQTSHTEVVVLVTRE